MSDFVDIIANNATVMLLVVACYMMLEVEEIPESFDILLE